MSNKYVQGCSTFIIIKEMKIKLLLGAITRQPEVKKKNDKISKLLTRMCTNRKSPTLLVGVKLHTNIFQTP